MKRLIVTLLCALAYATLPAQTLVIYDARDLFPKDAWSPACKAVFTEEYYYSQEWQDLNDRINTYLLSRKPRTIRTGYPWPMMSSAKKWRPGKN